MTVPSIRPVFILSETHSLLRVGRLVHAPRPLQHLHEEESQSSDSLIDRVVGELLVAEQVGYVFANVLRAELVGRTVKITRKVLDDAQVGASGRFGEVTTLDFLQH
jgi:hypothetical protein